MSNKILSFEIGAQVTKICLVSFRQKNPKVYKTLVLATPYDCVEDGYIKDVNTLASAIGKKLREEKISIGHAVFTISSTKIANREVIIPMVKEQKIKEIVEANAEDYFPIDVKDYNITYIMMEKINTKDIKNYRILVLAVHNNLLMTYHELAEHLKLKIDSIDYVGNSVYQIYQKQVDQGTNMVVQMNEQNTMINVMQRKVLELQRIIPYGYDVVINTVLDHTNDKITKEEEAFHQLRDKPLIQPRFVDNHQNTFLEEGMIASTKQEEFLYEITNSLRYLVNNIMRVVDYYVSKKTDVKLQTIYLTGMGAKLNGIDRLLANEIGIEVKILDVLQGVTFVHPINIENFVQSDFIACAGATIEPVGMQPAKYAIRETYKNNLVAVTTISSLAILTSLILWFISDKAVKDAEEEKLRLLTQITELESIDMIYTDNLRISEELETIKGLKDLCYSSNEALVSLITEMEKKLPSNVIVHSMTAGTSGIVLNLTADTKETAAMTLMQLKTIRNLTDVTTTGISEQMDEYGAIEINFSVLAMYSIQEQDGGETE